MNIKKPTSRTKTIGRAFGYSDDDLSTPGHDALCLWARRNMWTLLQEMMVPPLWMLHEAVPGRVAEEENKRYQRDLERKSRYPSGREPNLPKTLPELSEKWFSWYKPELEKRIPGGWIDVYTSGNAYCDYVKNMHTGDPDWSRTEWRFAIEVKTTIRSLGELIRQLRVYQEWVRMRPPFSQICVLSPDATFAEDLREEGFLFHVAQIPPSDQGSLPT